MAKVPKRVVCICDNCFRWAPNDPPTAEEPYPHWKTDRPCEHCGAHDWVAHDTDRDPRSGRLLDPSQLEEA